MNNRVNNTIRNTKSHSLAKDEKGSAMVIALLVMILLMGFVALAVSRTTTETIASANDAAETRAFEAAHASLEVMTRNFNKNFETKLNILPADITRIQGQLPPGFDADYLIDQIITQTQATKNVVMTGEKFQGLYALRDEWQLNTSATRRQDGVQVLLRRRFFNDRIPIFQFGIFYDDDLEFHPGPRFDFGGRVHSNGSLFLNASDGLYFASKVSTANNVFTDISKNGSPWTNWNDEVFIKNASGTFVQLQYNMGSVLGSVVNGAPVTGAPLPTSYTNATWGTTRNLFQGNLLAGLRPIDLPIKLNSDIQGTTLDLVEIVKRGKKVGDLWNDGTGTVAAPNLIAVTAATSDDQITAADRYYNKTGIRVSLADGKAKLPGCTTPAGGAVTTVCGIRLDGNADGLGAYTAGTVQGYVPRAMTGAPAYQATAINGDRFKRGILPGRETWIKVETVVFNAATQAYDTEDITQDFLALGVTEAAPNIGGNFSIIDANYTANAYDSRSIIKLQRFVIPGAVIPNTTGAAGSTTYISNGVWGGNIYNYVAPATIPRPTPTSPNRCNDNAIAATVVNGGIYTPIGFTGDNRAHWKTATIAGLEDRYGCVVPIPINMFDTREGLFNDTVAVFNPLAVGNYGLNVPWAGVMSLIDIDVANLRAFLSGTHNARMPGGTPYALANGHVLRSTDIPQNQGWVLYVSDRRGDFDFDGEYDMEDVFGQNDGIMQPGEDINNSTNLQADYANEGVRYTGAGNHVSPDIAAIFEHKHFRRGVRLVNGTTLPGIYDIVAPANTRGFAVASENGVYVLGNYNATGIGVVGTPTASTDYLPQNTALHIPASISADAVTILSNNWKDAISFTAPFNRAARTTTETTTRFAMISGDTITSLNDTPNQGGGDLRMNGGVHNFLRFLETWGGRLNYSGSLINLYNSHNNNGAFKCCNTIYSPPTRNWVFDATFLDINRLPPGTPYFQSLEITGFQRVN